MYICEPQVGAAAVPNDSESSGNIRNNKSRVTVSTTTRDVNVMLLHIATCNVERLRVLARPRGAEHGSKIVTAAAVF